MYLTYIDESGDTGTNLKDQQQPIFVLCALLIPEERWHSLEFAFRSIVSRLFNGSIPEQFELHTTDLKSRRGFFKSFTSAQTFQFRDDLFGLIEQFQLPVRYMKIIKRDYESFCHQHYGPGIHIEPYLMALPFLCRDIDRFLVEQGSQGILIFDEHRMASDIDKSLWTLRLDGASSLRTGRILEKGFSIQSHLSVPLQLADFLAYYLRKWEEHKAGWKVSVYDQQVFNRLPALAKPFAVDGYQDIFAWVAMQAKRK